MPDVPDTRRAGLVAGVAAYALWGLFPVYWHLLEPATPFEILAQRIVWSFVFVTALLFAFRTPWDWLPLIFQRRQLPQFAAMSVFIAMNWGTYIIAVNTGHVVEASVGYFINPLVSLLFGVLIFKERIGRYGRIGVALTTAGVGILAWESWSTLWISLTLAFSFGLYGVTKKRASLPALPGLWMESGLLLVPSLIFLGFLAATGGLHLGQSAPHDALMVLTGPITAIPLWLFALAASRLPLGVLGVLQYLAPTVQLILGITFFGEHVTPQYWGGLGLIWAGSAIYLFETLRRERIARG